MIRWMIEYPALILASMVVWALVVALGVAILVGVFTGCIHGYLYLSDSFCEWRGGR